MLNVIAIPLHDCVYVREKYKLMNTTALLEFFKAFKSDAAFTNGMRDHPFLLSKLNEGFNEAGEKNKGCEILEWIWYLSVLKPV